MLYEKLKEFLSSSQNNLLNMTHLTEKYDWNKIVSKYDETLNDFKV